MSLLIENKTDVNETLKLNNLRKLKKITKKLQKLEGSVVINGKIHLLKDLILLKIGKRSD